MPMEGRLVEEACGSVGLSRGSVIQKHLNLKRATLPLSTAPSAALF